MTPPRPLDDRVVEAARRERLFDGVGRLVVACSAGGDSLALLHLLHGLRDRFELALAVAHLDHGWRGEEAARDAERVEEEAEGLGLEAFLERAEPAADEVLDESAGRRARHAFFRRVVERWDGDAAALGHTLDDQAETVLLSLARGAGRRGLAGMSPRTELDGLLLLRPLLGVRRAELREYLEERGRPWREDPTNRSERFARVRVRRRLLPLLAELHPGAVENVARAAQILGEEEAWIDDLVDSEYRRLSRPEEYPGGVAVDLEGLARAPTALRRRLVRRAVREVRGDLIGIDHDHVEAVAEVLAGAESARDLPGVRVRRQDGALRFLPLEDRELRAPDGSRSR